jgi:tetratricopeptide (TPR) repeat protein
MNPLNVRFYSLLPVVFLMSFMPGSALAQVGGNRVKLTGTVVSTVDNKPIERAAIQLCDSAGNLIEQSSTTDSGEFGFRDLERGTYVLTVDAVGYQSEELHLNLSFMSDKGIVVQLKPTKKPDLQNTPTSGLTVSAHEMSMPREARELVSSGRTKLYTQKNPQASLDDFARALVKAPNYYEAHYETGMAQLQLGRVEDAEKSFQKSIEVSKGTYGDGEVALGTLLVEKGSASEGEKALRHGVDMNPNSWMGYFELGKLEFLQNRIDDARKSAEQARSLAPSAPMTYRLLANIHLKQKDYNAVLEDIDAYLKLDPSSPAGIRAKEMREEISKKVKDSK